MKLIFSLIILENINLTIIYYRLWQKYKIILFLFNYSTIRLEKTN